MPRVRPRKSKHWCFTINNPTRDDRKKINDAQEQISYIIINKEVGDTGTPHYQGYVCFEEQLRATQVKVILPRSHLEIKRGTVEEAIHYCKKPVEGCNCKHCVKARPQRPNFQEYGEVPLTKGEATKEKWANMYEHAKKGDFEEIPKNMLIRYYPAFKRIAQDNPEKPKDLETLGNLWITAPTGYGKSRYVRDLYPDFYDKAPNKWFVGYKGEETILLDDLGPEHCKYLAWYIKRWADLYSFPMETKGGGRQIRPKRVVVTSQYTIEECFEDWKAREAVERRFEVLELTHWRIRVLEDVQTAHGIVRVNG